MAAPLRGSSRSHDLLWVSPQEGAAAAILVIHCEVQMASASIVGAFPWEPWPSLLVGLDVGVWPSHCGESAGGIMRPAPQPPQSAPTVSLGHKLVFNDAPYLFLLSFQLLYDVSSARKKRWTQS